MNEADLQQAYQAGRWAREAHRDRESAPRYEMGVDGLKRRWKWQAGWDARDGELGTSSKPVRRGKR